MVWCCEFPRAFRALASLGSLGLVCVMSEGLLMGFSAFVCCCLSRDLACLAAAAICPFSHIPFTSHFHEAF